MLTSLTSRPSRFAIRSRTLPEAAYDALTLRCPKSRIRVGRGSWIYPVAGGWMPEAWVDWAVEEKSRRVEEVDDEFERVEGILE